MSNGLQSGKGHHDNNWWFAKDKANNLGAVVGFVASYYFMPNLWIDLSWTRYIVNKKVGYNGNAIYGDYQPDADLYALGIAYKFNF